MAWETVAIGESTLREQWLVRVVAIIVVGSVAGMLTSCSQARGGNSANSTPSTSIVTTTSVGRPERAEGNDAAIVAAWLAAQRAFHDAALTSNAEDPELAEAMVPPQLNRARAFLHQMAADGYIARGSTDYGMPRVVKITGARAVVVSCVYDSENALTAATGRPVPGILGQSGFEALTSSMSLTMAGWRLADQSVVVGGCNG